MADGTRQQRRRMARELQKAGERTLARGLAPKPGADDMLGVVQVLAAKLLEPDNPQRAGEAAHLAHALSTRSLRSHPSRSAIACKKGCGYCCYSFVAALPPEVFRLAQVIRSSTSVGLDIGAVLTRAQPLRGLTPEQRFGAKLACPLLIDGMCSVYDSRPLVCRQTTSVSLPACIEEYDGIQGDGHVEISPTHLAHASNAYVAMLAALMALKHSTQAYELGAMLEVALSDADSERRWLEGEDVFSTIATPVVRSRRVDQAAERLASELVRLM
jgi:hypothetical protein